MGSTPIPRNTRCWSDTIVLILYSWYGTPPSPIVRVDLDAEILICFVFVMFCFCLYFVFICVGYSFVRVL